MGLFFIILGLIIYTMACCFLIFVILVQSGKGGGLSTLGSASQGISDALGATGAERTLTRMTTWSAVLFMVLAIMLSLGGGRALKPKKLDILKEKAPVTAPLTQSGQGAPAGVRIPAKQAIPAEKAPVAPAKPATQAPAPAAPAKP